MEDRINAVGKKAEDLLVASTSINEFMEEQIATKQYSLSISAYVNWLQAKTLEVKKEHDQIDKELNREL